MTASLLKIRKMAHTGQYYLINIITVITYALYFAVIVGTKMGYSSVANATKILEWLNFYVKIYVSVFLIWRFNPFRHVQFTRLDAKIAFNCAVFLLMTTAVGSFIRGLETSV